MQSPDRTIDLAVRAGLLLASAEAPLLSDVAVLIDAGRVLAVTTDDGEWTARNTVDARDQLVTPGLVNAHTHLGLSFTRGLTHRGGEPIYDIFWPLEAHLQPGDVEVFSRLAAAESLLAGVTTVFDHYAFASHAETATREIGLRAWLGETVMTCAGPFSDGSLDRAIAHLATPRPKDSLVRAVVAPHALDTIDRGVLSELGEMADSHAAPLHLHLAQSTTEDATIRDRDGMTPVALAKEIGFLDRPALLAHCSYIDADDFRLLAVSRDIVAVYCPTVHAMDGMVQPAAELADSGAIVAVGTDAPPKDDYDLISEARGAVVGQRQRGHMFTPRQAFAAVTTSTAPVSGEPLLGQIVAGAPADIVCWDLSSPRMALADDPLNALVMSPPGVASTIVGGRVRVSDGHLVEVELEELIEDALAHRKALFERAGL